MENILNKNYTYAIIGASTDETKFGFKVLKQLTDAGYKTVPINPKKEPILGQVTHKNLRTLRQAVDVAVFVTQPKITEQILKTMNGKVNKVWLQPGSENEESIKFCEENNIFCIHNACIMIAQANEAVEAVI